ncbi:ankyrin repeat-containing domain protein [Daldinia sp. FL1419]|nr:ankyrin repeat-containing domain protein [Daldinia sp. FL1419]
MSNIQSLPNEIFDLVIEHLIISIGIYRSFILRPVSRRFNAAILFAICHRQVLDVKHPATPRLINNMPLAPKGRILLTKSLTEEINRDDAIFVIARVNQALDDLTQPSKEQQTEQHQMVAEAIARRYPYYIELPKSNNFNAKMNPWNTLMGAIAIGNLPVVKMLLTEQKVDINESNPYFGQPLQVAVMQGHLQVVRYLLDNGADPRRDGEDDGEDRLSYSSFPISALGVAVEGGHEDVIEFLMQPEYRPSPTKDEYLRIVFDAIRFGRLHFIQALFRETGKKLSDFAEYGSSMLHTAVSYDQLELAKMFLDNQIDVNGNIDDKRVDYYGYLMRRAASRGNPRMIQLLLDYGADPDPPCDLEYPYGYDESLIPVAIAGIRGHEEVVELLLAHITDVNSIGRALISAAEGGQTHLMDIIWKKDPQLHTKPWPIYRPPRTPPPESTGANFITRHTRTVGGEALARAISGKSPRAIALLAEHGVPLDEKYFGELPIVLARYRSAQWIADFMLSIGAKDVDVDDEVAELANWRGDVHMTKDTWEWGSKY